MDRSFVLFDHTFNSSVTLYLVPMPLVRNLIAFIITIFNSGKQGGRPRVADFIHGSDGLGNVFIPPPETKKIEKNAAEFLVDTVSQYPGEVSILALGPLTNLALVS